MTGASLSMLGYLRGLPPSRPHFMDAGTVTLRTVDKAALKDLSELPTELALEWAASFLVDLVEDPDFLEAEVRPFLEEAKGKKDWYVAHCYEGEDASYSLQVFVWPPGTKTKIHDHSSWGVYCCALGSVLEERYERLDDGARLDHARLKKVWQLLWSREDGASSVLPND